MIVKLRPLQWIQITATGKRLLFQWQVGQLRTKMIQTLQGDHLVKVLSENQRQVSKNRNMEYKNFIPTWQIRKSNTGTAKCAPGYPANSRNTLDRRREDNTRKPHNDILRWRKAQKWSGNCNEEQCSKINDGILGNFR